MIKNDLEQLTASEARVELASGRLTSQSLVAACLARIADRDQAVAAWAHIDADRALAAARASDALRSSGKSMPALSGIPVGIKDIIDTSDYPTELGSVVFAGRRPSADAFIVSELRAAGAIILGKTVTTELAFFGPGKTRNPRHPEHTPGGSSSGSAAAVADSQVPLAVGTPLMAISQSDDIWVVANFKETQLENMKIGQTVYIKIDAYPNQSFRGKVESLQAGTGSRFSLLPPENATGNFVKVVQRVPVKIVFDEKPPDELLLAPGMSAEPSVKVR